MKECIKPNNSKGKGAALVETSEAKVEVITLGRDLEPSQDRDLMVGPSLILSWDFSHHRSKTKKINSQEVVAMLKLENKILQEAH
jgi:hypothetical protein